MAKIHKFGLANSLLDSPMATWLTLTGTLTTRTALLHVNDFRFRIHGTAFIGCSKQCWTLFAKGFKAGRRRKSAFFIRAPGLGHANENL